jgi:hypothetical protein
MAFSKDEIQALKHEESNSGENQIGIVGKPKSFKKIVILSIIIVFLVISVGLTVNFATASKPGQLDDFAKCLSENGAVMYGASFCQYSHGQKGMFGNSFKYVNYKDFSEDSNVKVTPTWMINGAYYQNVQTFDRLAYLSGCQLPR